MEENTKNILIDHLDMTLQGKSLAEAEQLIRQDPEAHEEWQYLQLAVKAIQYEGLYSEVAAVKEQYLTENQAKQIPAQKPVIRVLRITLRVAAAVLLLAGAFVVYTYFSTSSRGFYRNYYASFELPVSRGETGSDKLELAYRNKDWNEVIAFFETIPQKNNKHLFLAGMAKLELKQYNDAIEKFEQVIANNNQAGDNYFRDEAEYYLAMSFLAAGKAKQARPLLKKIRADVSHLFHEKASAMPAMELKMLEYKSEG